MFHRILHTQKLYNIDTLFLSECEDLPEDHVKFVCSRFCWQAKKSFFLFFFFCIFAMLFKNTHSQTQQQANQANSQQPTGRIINLSIWAVRRTESDCRGLSVSLSAPLCLFGFSGRVSLPLEQPASRPDKNTNKAAYLNSQGNLFLYE